MLLQTLEGAQILPFGAKVPGKKGEQLPRCWLLLRLLLGGKIGSEHCRAEVVAVQVGKPKACTS